MRLLFSATVLSSVCLVAVNAGSIGERVRFPRAVKARTSYTLQDDYRGEAFFDEFNFFSSPDPTQGLVDYQSRENAISKGLAFVQDDGVTVLAVDNTTPIPSGSNRASVRIESKKQYREGLFIADFEAMPFGCSTWPAWWSYSITDYPNGGEIDVIEGVNSQPYNDMTFWHAGRTCTFPPDALSGGTGDIVDADSDCVDPTSEQMSCSFQDENPASFGEGFNAAGGGVYAHLVDAEGISIWHFTRSNIPNDITNQNPDPSTWGAPVAQWKSTSCDIAQHVHGHILTINTSLCGSWAGDDDVWAGSGCPGTCAETVADPGNFDNARWKINYVSAAPTSPLMLSPHGSEDTLTATPHRSTVI
ncbi:glycoside hydrolase family 16 protein [Moniliophthora roreri MCA 2997]|uniref:Glycoside hydrolase family 16 protein n=1 Tax=Moniliophthora roreri (strain MCA 2997) TaxID=1381753 RepID=V2WC05_MONRO|nr:glycoside hydrolase family 16 protein [Moniliophthora roreri MCA 2997]